jgi:hypothetical protein
MRDFRLDSFFGEDTETLGRGVWPMDKGRRCISERDDEIGILHAEEHPEHDAELDGVAENYDGEKAETELQAISRGRGPCVAVNDVGELGLQFWSTKGVNPAFGVHGREIQPNFPISATD